MNEIRTFEGLVAIMDRLRDPDHGCPWDLEQDYDTLRGYLLEECHEVAEAIDDRSIDGLREELGDLLFQIVFLARLAKEQGRFTAQDVVEGIASKMIRRHPHVFGDDDVEDSDHVLRNWESIKRAEKGEAHEKRSVLDGIPRSLPALLKAQRLGTKAGRVGFDWPDHEGVLGKVREEGAELGEAVNSGDRERISEELGDLLFALAMLARKLEVDPEQALERANTKFYRRFRRVELEVARRGVPLEEAGLELLDRLWDQVKKSTR